MKYAWWLALTLRTLFAKPKICAVPTLTFCRPRCFFSLDLFLQYVLIRLVSTAVALGLQLGHLYTEGDFDPKRGYLWITVVTCCSQSWALYVLVLFYRSVESSRVQTG